MELRRRELLKLGLFGSAALMLPAERLARTKLAVSDRIAASRLPKPFTIPFGVPPVLDPVRKTETTDIYALVQEQASVEILPGLKTDIWAYNGVTPGPTIVVQQGRETIVRQANSLPGLHPQLRYKPWTSTHLHGSASKPQYDGYASDITKVGQTKRYDYPNKQDARTLWYHDHGVHHTAENAYMGLAAQYHLHDDVEKGLTIPKWDFDTRGKKVVDQYDLPLILADKMFSANGEFRYDDAGHTGLWGDVVLVNG